MLFILFLILILGVPTMIWICLTKISEELRRSHSLSHSLPYTPIPWTLTDLDVQFQQVPQYIDGPSEAVGLGIRLVSFLPEELEDE